MRRKTYAVGPLVLMGFITVGFFIIGGFLGLWGTYKLISADWGRLMIPIIIGIMIIVAIIQKSKRPPAPPKQAVILRQGERARIF